MAAVGTRERVECSLRGDDGIVGGDHRARAVTREPIVFLDGGRVALLAGESGDRVSGSPIGDRDGKVNFHGLAQVRAVGRDASERFAVVIIRVVDHFRSVRRYRVSMRAVLFALLLALGTGCHKKDAVAPVTADWVARDFGEGRVQYRVPGDWQCQSGAENDAICVGKDENDVTKISAGVPNGPPAEVYERLKAASPGSQVTRMKIHGHEAIEARGGDGAIVVLVFSDDNKYFFMLGWLLKAPFAPQCRAVLETVAFGS